jgi:catechol 2,3-dioxygenase-like lactoylglutathione lyase family enzyme
MQLDHVAVNARDPMALVRFYVDVLGLEPSRVEEYERGEVPFPSVRLTADTILDFFPEKLWQGGRPDPAGSMNHLCLAMPTRRWEALKALLQDRGVEIEQGPDPRWGAHGTGISIYFRDPEGNMVEARHYPES